jgi:hypothetical protein
MKIIIGVVLALCLTLSVVPAIADDTFQAFHKMSAGERALPTPLSDDQLASIEGANSPIDIGPIDIGINVAITPQLNICVVCTDVEQGNAAASFQAIRF